MKGRVRIDLIGDCIENQANAEKLVYAAQMFGSECTFRDKDNLFDTTENNFHLNLTSLDEILEAYPHLLALDNLKKAVDIYGFKPSFGGSTALIVGNERKGISTDLAAAAKHAIEIPMVSKKLNSLNVAAAAAVGLYYLTVGGGGKLQVHSNPQKRRPEVYVVGASNHIEIGSTIRSCGAFGWSRVLVEDRCKVWFGCNRVVHAESRSAARRHRNPIRLVPTSSDQCFSFKKVSIVTTRKTGTPLRLSRLNRGSDQVIVIPDEAEVDIDNEDWGRFGDDVEFVHLETGRSDYTYCYRLIATIALAETARQVGQRNAMVKARRIKDEPVYDSALKLLLEGPTELVFQDELSAY